MEIQGLFETHLHVADLKRSAAFYEDILGLELAFVSPRQVRFYWVGGKGQAMLGLWQKEPSQIQRQHFAFRISPTYMEQAIHHLKTHGIPVHNFLADGTDRPFVFAWMPAVSIYFADPDGHSLEFISMLPDPPKPELGEKVFAWDK
ncbi:VOC family protein [Thermoflavimicrobium daqui]|jgi:catechol 2,3-dioxygenase-like lactoylglutathione lyase family enzyme|uniref:Glyoxalase n=1 Tax=Thermoflavimicrobium daqui TaxID=2137476 RepID=A0A364K194_9BACL|nr:VOC family protein [Thermoflavimicrobium daqui]RAL21454.1 glyoxalase [Thermoflavimicrobium daqui]